MSGFVWLTCRPVQVRRVAERAFHVRWLDEPASWHDAPLVACAPAATLLRPPGAWLLLTRVAAPVCYRDEAAAREAYAAACGA